jgi:glycosyltransferase involved in cell wall biosynthesis
MSRRWGLLVYALDRRPSGIGHYSLSLLSAYHRLAFAAWVIQAGGWPVGYDPSTFTTLRLRGASLLPALLTLGQLQLGWQTHRHDLAFVHDLTGALPLAFCPAPCLVTLCDAIPFVHPGASTLLERLVYRCWLPFAVRSVRAVITLSQQSKTDLEKHLKIPGKVITVIPLAAGAQFRLMQKNEIQPALKRAGVEQPYILYVGSLEPRKNLLRLLQAYHQLLAWSTRWSLVIVGARNPWSSTPIAAEVESLVLGSRVRFTGYLPDEDLPALYNAADLFCFPSLYEGFGLPVLEAMACGVPVLTSNTSSLPEVAGEAAILVDPYNVSEIAAAMRQILSDPDLAADLRWRGLQRAARFTWQRTALATIAAYEKILGEKLS